MLRLTEIKLPLEHSEDDLLGAAAHKLEITRDDLQGYSVYKRSYDARKKNNILLIYQLDVSVEEKLEQALLEKFATQPFCRPSPDTRYHFVAQANSDFPAHEQQRPVVIGFGPCGILDELLFALGRFGRGCSALLPKAFCATAFCGVENRLLLLSCFYILSLLILQFKFLPLNCCINCLCLTF